MFHGLSDIEQLNNLSA